MDSNHIINNKLLETIGHLLPQKYEQLDFLMQELALGKESAYRRLRGEVAFSFSEARIISDKLGFTLDSVVKAALKKINPTFLLHSIPPESIQDYNRYIYQTNIGQQKLMKELASDPTSKLFMALNIIPQEIIFWYKNLSRFRNFVWMYQIQNSSESYKLSSVNIDDSMIDQQNAMEKRIIFSENTYIISRNIFRSLIKLIKYFFRLNLITDDELLLLKDELLEMIDELEKRSTQDSSITGKKIWIYLSNIDFESNYAYLSTANFQRSYVDIYYLNTIFSSDPLICTSHRQWIESFKKFSTLISGSGGLERARFLEKQRELVQMLHPTPVAY